MRYNLLDVAKIKYGKNQKKVVSDSGTVPIYGTGGLMGYATEPLYDRPSVLIGRKGTIDKVRYVTEPFWTVDTLFYTVINTDIVRPHYLYYLLSQIDFAQMNEGTTIPSLRTETLNRIELDIPSFDYQDKVLSIVEPMEEKIELNTAINKNLEQQAQALYRHMFCDRYNAICQKGILCDIANITMGQSPKGSSYNEAGIGTIFFQGRAEFGFRFPKVRLFTTAPKRLASVNDVLMSVRAPVGDINVAFTDCCIGRGLAAIRSKTNHQSFILYTLYALQQELSVFNREGTVFGSVNGSDLNKLPVTIPPHELMNKFERIVAPIDMLIRNNCCEIHRLQNIRDALLPQLMSGEADISNIRI